MSRSFDFTLQEHLDAALSTGLTYPFSFGIWLNAATLRDQTLFSLSESGSSAQWCGIQMDGSGNAYASIRSAYVAATATFSATTWVHLLAVFPDDTHRTIYLNGGNKATDTATASLSGSFDQITIGAERNGAGWVPGQFANGLLAWAGLWNMALGDSDAVDLATNKYAPRLVQAANLIGEWHLTGTDSPELDTKGSQNLSLTGTVGGTDPPGIVTSLGATAVTLSGPSGGNSGVASTNFTVGVDTTPITGTLNVTPTTTLSGTFTPTSVALTTGSPTATFTFTPSVGGAHHINCTNDGGLTAPADVVYTVTAQYAYPISDISIGSWQAKGPGLETVRNLLTYTEALDNAAWTKTNTTITPDAANDPSGNPTVDLIAETNAGNTLYSVKRNVTATANLDYATSLDAKPGGRDWLLLIFRAKDFNAYAAYFNLATGVLGTVSVGATASIVVSGAGLYRCCVVANAASGGGTPSIEIYTADGDLGDQHVGAAGVGIYASRCQFEQASSPSTYQPILATDPPLAVVSSPIYPALADGSTGTPVDADYGFVLVPGSTLKVGLTPMTDPSLSDGHTFEFRAYSPQSRQLQADIYFDGGLVKSTMVMLTPSVALHTVTLSGAEADSIVDYSTGQIWLTGIA